MLPLETISGRQLRIAILGTRGIPACYGGFETFAEELSWRLVERGHRVTVYGRSGWVEPGLREHRGVQICVLPSFRHKYLDTVSHTTLSVLHALSQPYHLLLFCNAANAFLCGIPGFFQQKVVLNVDGIERKRRKWNRLGKLFYRLGEFLATQLPDAVVTDAAVVRDYYLQEYAFESRFIAYGASLDRTESRETLDSLALTPGTYLLFVSRFEPENNAHLVVQAYLQAGVRQPLVLVGDAPYGDAYIKELKQLASLGHVLMPGAIYGTGYRELLGNCLCYIQSTEVGGTHPALVEALGAGCLVLANDTPEHREVVGEAGLFYPFNDQGELSSLMRKVAEGCGKYESLKERARMRVLQHYSWEEVVRQYEGLFYEILDPPTG